METLWGNLRRLGLFMIVTAVIMAGVVVNVWMQLTGIALFAWIFESRVGTDVVVRAIGVVVCANVALLCVVMFARVPDRIVENSFPRRSTTG